MVGKSAGLSVGEVAEMLGGVHPETVRRYLKAGLLRALPRLPKGHRRIVRESVEELMAAMAEPDGPEKEARLKGIVDRHLGRSPEGDQG